MRIVIVARWRWGRQWVNARRNTESRPGRTAEPLDLPGLPERN